MSWTRRAALVALILGSWVACAADDTKRWIPDIPKVWDDAALADWMTPVAGLNVRPAHIPAKEYYAMPEYNLRAYPVYMPGREPEGYWEMLQRVGPQRLFEPEKLKTEADWIAAGERIFEEATTPQLTTFDPQLIAQIRDPEFMERHDAKSLPDGTILLLRWVPTSRGVGLASDGVCGGCHTLRGVACWMERNVEVQNAPAGMFDNEETVQRAEIKVGNGEEVECGKRFTMILKKSRPLARFAFVRIALQPSQIPRYSRFGDVETEH